MLYSLLFGGASMRDILLRLLITIPIVLSALTVHECSHGWVSYKCGDPTARNLGRLTLNPIKHLDPIGTICMLLFGFGWAKPVPVNSRYYRKPRAYMALVAAAGPLSNILLAFFNIIIFNILWLIPVPDGGSFAYNIFVVSTTFFYLAAQMNIYLAVFNLIPIPPLDGSRILYIFLPPKWYFGVMRYERYIQIGLLALLWLGVFDLPLSWLSGNILNGMQWLIHLIPIFK